MRLYDWWYDRQGQVLVFITELLTDGSLRRFIRRKHAAGITLSALKRYAWQILQGLVYLHGHYPPIIHRWAGAGVAWSPGAGGAWLPGASVHPRFLQLDWITHSQQLCGCVVYTQQCPCKHVPHSLS